MAGPIRISILADASQATKEVEKVNSSFKDKLGKASKFAAGALAGLGAAGVGAALQAEKIASANARVGNVLSNMGMDTATKRVLEYADGLEKSLGIDEEVIKNTQAKLGTFQSLAKTAGEAGGAFDRATLAAQDMAAAGFGQAETNAVQLGKALEDPTKGLNAMARSGITFTAQEQKKIKALQKSGKLFEAQDIILKAVEKQVGGTAAATADSSAKMTLAFGEVVESVGTLLLPVMDKAAVYAQKLADVAGKHPKVFLAVAGAIAALATGIIVLNAIIKTVTAVTKAWTAVQAAFNVVMALNPVVLVVIAIIALVAAIVIAYQKSETFRKIVDAAFSKVKDAGLAMWEAIKKGLNFLRELPGRAKKAIGNLGKLLVRAGKELLNGLLKGAKFIWDHSLVGFIVNRRQAIVRAIGNVGRLLYQKGKDVLGGLKAGAVWAFDHSVRPYLNLGGKILRAVGNLGRLLFGAGKDILLGLRDGLVYAWENYVAPYLRRVTDLIPDWKGPRQKDAKLLTESGRLIMGSLLKGFDDGVGSVEQFLSRFTSDIPGFVNVAVDPITPLAVGGGGSTAIRITLSSEQVSQLQRGREIQADLDAYKRSGGRARS